MPQAEGLLGLVTERSWTHSTPGLRQKGLPPIVGIFFFWQTLGHQSPDKARKHFEGTFVPHPLMSPGQARSVRWGGYSSMALGSQGGKPGVTLAIVRRDTGTRTRSR